MEVMTKHSTKHARIRGPRATFALLATVSALVLAGPVALAQAGDATQSQYGNEVQQVAGSVGGGGGGGGGGSAPAASHAATTLQNKVVGGLPFTGLDLVALLGVAVALTSLGLGLRRLTTERHVS
jgi:hypothetical protein